MAENEVIIIGTENMGETVETLVRKEDVVGIGAEVVILTMVVHRILTITVQLRVSIRFPLPNPTLLMSVTAPIRTPRSCLRSFMVIRSIARVCRKPPSMFKCPAGQ